MLGKDVRVGQLSVIEDDVIIGDNCTIGHHVVINKGSIIGNNVRIDDHAVIGKQPMRATTSIFKKKVEEEQLPCRIGDDCTIGTSSIIYAGAQIEKGCLVADLATVREDVVVGSFTIVGRGVATGNGTRIGSKCKIETNAYITVLSIIKDEVFIGSCVDTSNDYSVGRDPDRLAKMKGLVAKRKARIGVNATIHPEKVVGEDAFVGAGAVDTKDVPDGVTVVGNPAKSKMS